MTRPLPGQKWLDILKEGNCRVDILPDKPDGTGASEDEIKNAIGDKCDGVIGQLTENWDKTMFEKLKSAGGIVYSNYAVGYNNVDVEAATQLRILVGNTPGVLTETTAETALALTFAAARRVIEGHEMVRTGQFRGWSPTLLLGKRLHGGTLGVIGLGRIGQAYARSLAAACAMHILYTDTAPVPAFHDCIASLNTHLEASGIQPVTVSFVPLEELLQKSDVVSIHTTLNPTTHHLISTPQLRMMKKDAILINTARGPIIDETALVAHLREHPEFRAGLDVFENEPALAPGLAELPNVVLLPHLGSATEWTRQAMAALAASNVAGVLNRWPLWRGPKYDGFMDGDGVLHYTPSIINADRLGYDASQ